MNDLWRRGTRGPMIGDLIELRTGSSGPLVGRPLDSGGFGFRPSDCSVGIFGDTNVEIEELPDEWRNAFGLSEPVVGVLHPNGSLTLPDQVIPVLPESLKVKVIQGGHTLR